MKFTITFRGREMAHTEIGHELMRKILAELGDVAIVESFPRQEGRSINTLHAGDFFGEIALVEDTPRTATVTATTPVRMLVITDRAFAQLLRQSPEISQGVLEAVGERLSSELS